jgi:N,N-dimethylformamidase
MSGPPLSPLPRAGLEGYASEVAVRPGDPLRFMLSGPPGTARFRIARLLHGDPSEAGPGYRDEEVDWGAPRSIEVAPRQLELGSYVRIPPSDRLSPSAGLTLALWFRPSATPSGWHALAVRWGAGDIAYGLWLAGQNALLAAVSANGHTAAWCTGKARVETGRWQFAALVFDPESGELRLYQRLEGDEGLTSSSEATSVRELHASQSPLHLGAAPEPEDGTRMWAHFDGKLAHPLLLAEALPATTLAELAGGAPLPAGSAVAGAWDLAAGPAGIRVVDTSPNALHGSTINAPSRAVTGPHWRGEPALTYAEGAGDYNAIQLHTDDIDDARWPAAAELSVAAGAAPGIYAAHVECETDELFMPFVVAPAAPRAPLLFIVPTLTWQAYNSNRLFYNSSNDGTLDRGLCIYDAHQDGSMVHLCSRRRPTRTGNPRAFLRAWGAHLLTADLYLIDWLEHERLAYDVAADQHLHEGGAGLLEPYACVILGSHPEYVTGAMLDALAGYLALGGRIAYLGGNGLYWVTTLDPDRPHLMEVRKGGEGDVDVWTVPQPGEWMHATAAELGGTWARRGRPPRRLVGVEFTGSVFEHARGRWAYQRLEASRDPAQAWIFAGVESDVIGDYGLNLGCAAGFEMDAVQDWPWNEATPAPVVLARATHESFLHLGQVSVPPAAELALSSHANGGAVFAVGSVTWTGSLSHADYQNDVARITRNVLDRFCSLPRGMRVTAEPAPNERRNH